MLTHVYMRKLAITISSSVEGDASCKQFMMTMIVFFFCDKIDYLYFVDMKHYVRKIGIG